MYIYISISINIYKYISNKIPGQLEASFLIFLTLGSIKQSNTRTLQICLLKDKCNHIYIYLYVYIEDLNLVTIVTGGFRTFCY